MAHAQKPDFVFWRNGRVHLNRRWASVQSTTGSRGVRISGSNDGYTNFWGSVKGTGYTIHSPVSPSLPLPCITVCHHISSAVYYSTIAGGFTSLKYSLNFVACKWKILSVDGNSPCIYPVCIQHTDVRYMGHFTVSLGLTKEQFCNVTTLFESNGNTLRQKKTESSL